jgi:(p)ppGpp synthase/HD superfamily hydrolase
LPYILHPLEAMNILARHGVRDVEVLAAAVLHDVVEDCDVDIGDVQERFHRRVAEIVSALTKDPSAPATGRTREALERVRRGPPGARAVKMADRLSNVRDLESIGWTPEKAAAYLREALEIADAGAEELPSLAAVLRRAVDEKRALLGVSG